MGNIAYLLFLLGGAAIVVGVVLYNKKKPIRLTVLSVMVGALLVIISLPTILEDVEQQEIAEQAAAESKAQDDADAKRAAEEAEQNAPLDEKITNVINARLGSGTNTDKERIHKIEIYGDVANIWLNNDDNLTVNLTKKGMWRDTFDGLEELAKFEEITLFQFVWMATFTDTYGNESEQKVMMLDFSRETIDKINFENVDYNNAQDISDEYWEHEALN